MWEAPKGLRREDLAARVGGQKVQVRELKESIKRQRVGPVPRGDTQRKQDGRQEKPKQQEPVWNKKPSKKAGGGGAGKEPEGTADRREDNKPLSEDARNPPSKRREIDPGKKVQESTAGQEVTEGASRGGEANHKIDVNRSTERRSCDKRDHMPAKSANTEPAPHGIY